MEVAGGVRRGEEWVETVELVSGIDDVGAGREFLEGTAVARFVGDRPSGEIVLQTYEDAVASVHLVPPSQLGRRLLEVTGPDRHARPLLADIDSGRTLRSRDLRAERSPVGPTAGASSSILRCADGVIRNGQIKGDLHLHTDLSPDRANDALRDSGGGDGYASTSTSSSPTTRLACGSEGSTAPAWTVSVW